MSEDKELANDYMIFRQGQDSLLGENDSVEDGIEKIRSKLSDLANIKNLHFLMGAGASSGAIPTMARLIKIVEAKIEGQETANDLKSHSDGLTHDEVKARFQSVKEVSPNNLEDILGTLYSKREYCKG